MNKQRVSTDRAPRPAGPYSPGVLLGETLYVAGQLGIDPTTGTITATSITEECGQALRNVAAVIAAAGMAVDDVVKVTVFLVHAEHFDLVNAEYSRFLETTSCPPARSTVFVKALPLGAGIEIDAVAARASHG